MAMFNLLRNKTRDTPALPEGSPAPDFTLPSAGGAMMALRDLKGQPVVLAFYPADFTSVCGSQMALYNEALPMFEEYGARLLGISVDDVESHRAFSESQNLRFPLLADSDPLGEVARRYGVYDRRKKRSGRALFVIDRKGIIRWQQIVPNDVNPGADGILRALAELQVEKDGR